MKPACVVLDAMGVMFAAADDVEDLLIPFVASRSGTVDAQRIRSAYLDAGCRPALDACGEAPADIVFVDDRAKNVQAARAGYRVG